MSSARTISKGQTIGAYFGSLLNTDFSKQLREMEPNGEQTIAAPISTLSRFFIVLFNMVIDRRAVKHLLPVVTEIFCPMGLINDARYSVGDATPHLLSSCYYVETTLFSSTRNQQFTAMISLDSDYHWGG